MIDRPLEVPERSGEVLLAPAGVDLLDLARRNRRSLAGERTPIAGVPLGELRERARAEILPLARRYSAAMDVGAVPEGDLLLATGHQPVFPHPGIWVKYLLLDRLAGEGHTGLVVIVDSDAMEEAGVDVPSFASSLVARHHETLRSVGPEEAYETQPPPTEDEWAGFLDRVDQHIQTVPEAEIREPWQEFLRLPRPSVSSFTAFLTALRRRYEGPRGYLDAPVSAIAESEAFGRFFLHIARDAGRFVAVHNRHLEAYREQHRLRTEAQPFANLERAGDRIELPFWTLVDGRRRRLLLDTRHNTVGPPEGPTVPLPADPADPTFIRLRLRPRALTLTAFTRLLLVDLFIHGVSGGRYDRVTDQVIADFFEVAPPAYAVASATLHLPFAGSADPEAKRQALQRMIQEARHNPERLLAHPSPEQQALVEEKWRQIRRLDELGLTRRDRRAATGAIRQINERLRAALAERLSEMEAALAALDERRGATDAAAFRGYPFFLFRREEVEGLVTKMLAGGSR